MNSEYGGLGQVSKDGTALLSHLQALLESGHIEAAQCLIRWHLTPQGTSDEEVLE